MGVSFFYMQCTILYCLKFDLFFGTPENQESGHETGKATCGEKKTERSAVSFFTLVFHLPNDVTV